MITFAFDIKKAVQIINHLLKRNNGALNYTKLLKLLYVADKQALSQYDMTITGDTYVSMDHGPVLSEIYNLVMGRSNVHHQLYWDGFFCRDAYDLATVQPLKPVVVPFWQRGWFQLMLLTISLRKAVIPI